MTYDAEEERARIVKSQLEYIRDLERNIVHVNALISYASKHKITQFPKYKKETYDISHCIIPVLSLKARLETLKERLNLAIIDHIRQMSDFDPRAQTEQIYKFAEERIPHQSTNMSERRRRRDDDGGMMTGMLFGAMFGSLW